MGCGCILVVVTTHAGENKMRLTFCGAHEGGRGGEGGQKGNFRDKEISHDKILSKNKFEKISIFDAMKYTILF